MAPNSAFHSISHRPFKILFLSYLIFLFFQMIRYRWANGSFMRCIFWCLNHCKTLIVVVHFNCRARKIRGYNCIPLAVFCFGNRWLHKIVEILLWHLHIQLVDIWNALQWSKLWRSQKINNENIVNQICLPDIKWIVNLWTTSERSKMKLK